MAIKRREREREILESFRASYDCNYTLPYYVLVCVSNSLQWLVTKQRRYTAYGDLTAAVHILNYFKILYVGC